VARLRAPEGCPWDREQTHSTLRPYLLEEAHEVLESLDAEDVASLQEELGDLLLQILLHTQIAIEDSEFKMSDVVAHIVAKLKRRHPHVFGEVRVSGAQEVVVNWQRIKDEEKAQASDKAPLGALSGVPAALPALARSQALKLRASRVGFHWPDLTGAWSKVDKETRELQGASTVEEQEDRLGDVLFSLATVASWLNLDAESALRKANSRFEQHFQSMENICAARRQKPEDLTAAELAVLWDQAHKERG
jgi:tetrapyrrole methylase family protein/MazG family protein